MHLLLHSHERNDFEVNFYKTFSIHNVDRQSTHPQKIPVGSPFSRLTSNNFLDMAVLDASRLPRLCFSLPDLLSPVLGLDTIIQYVFFFCRISICPFIILKLGLVKTWTKSEYLKMTRGKHVRKVGNLLQTGDW